MSAISKCPGIVKPVFVTASVLGTITALAIAAIFVPPLAAALTISAMTAAYIAIGTGSGAVITLIAAVTLLKRSPPTNVNQVEKTDALKLDITQVADTYIAAIDNSLLPGITNSLRKKIQLLRDNHFENNKEFIQILTAMDTYSKTTELPGTTRTDNDRASFTSISSRLSTLITANNLDH